MHVCVYMLPDVCSVSARRATAHFMWNVFSSATSLVSFWFIFVNVDCVHRLLLFWPSDRKKEEIEATKTMSFASVNRRTSQHHLVRLKWSNFSVNLSWVFFRNSICLMRNDAIHFNQSILVNEFATFRPNRLTRKRVRELGLFLLIDSQRQNANALKCIKLHFAIRRKRNINFLPFNGKNEYSHRWRSQRWGAENFGDIETRGTNIRVSYYATQHRNEIKYLKIATHVHETNIKSEGVRRRRRQNQLNLSERFPLIYIFLFFSISF